MEITLSLARALNHRVARNANIVPALLFHPHEVVRSPEAMMLIIRLEEEEQSVLMIVDDRTIIGVDQAVADPPVSTRAGWPEKDDLSTNRMEHAGLKE